MQDSSSFASKLPMSASPEDESFDVSPPSRAPHQPLTPLPALDPAEHMLNADSRRALAPPHTTKIRDNASCSLISSGDESPDYIDSDVEDELFEQQLREEGERDLERLELEKNNINPQDIDNPISNGILLSPWATSPPRYTAGTVATTSMAMPSRPRSRESFSSMLIRIPLLLGILSILFVDLILYIMVRQWVNMWESLTTWVGRGKELRQKLHQAKTYKEWSSYAKELDKYLGNEEWTKIEHSNEYDVPLIRKMARKLKRLRSSGDPSAVREVRKVLAHGACKADVGGVQCAALYSHTYYGTKDIVESYVEETVASLYFVARSSELSLEDRKQFLKLASRNYGKTALCLSGGATFAYYHLGVLKALFDEGLLPPVITGTSGGSLIGAMICCRTDQELKDEVFTPDIYKFLNACSDPFLIKMKRLFTKGALFDENDWVEKMQWITKGNMTFLEAYRKTGRILNISVIAEGMHSSSKVLNYITAPDTVIYSAVIASSAIPFILRPIELVMKDERGHLVPYRAAGRRWRDGSLITDIPEKTLHQLFNVNYTIVSQANPHIVLWFYHSRGAPGSPSTHRHGKGWRGGFLASTLVTALKLDIIKWIRVLRDLDMGRINGIDLASVFLQRFEGNCTIVPTATWYDYIFILSDPDRQRTERYFDVGAERTFPKMHMIANRMRIEQTLNKLRSEINYQLKLVKSYPCKNQRKMSAPEFTTSPGKQTVAHSKGHSPDPGHDTDTESD
ncbi:hypothetical protein SeMB42_g01913 [Synchytrium endobioticum]|nr:hypothetical protein SeMB42_g01913 [Synchytrium endobioticum]